MANRHFKSPRLVSLADLIDLERQFQLDRAQSRAALLERDHAIAAKLETSDAQPRQMILGWLDGLRRDDTSGPGRHIARAFDLIAFGLMIVGLLLGAAAVTGWLSIESGKPINAIHFWGALVGLQVVVLAFSLAAVLFRMLRWNVPGFSSLIGIGKPIMMLLLKLPLWFAISDRHAVRDVMANAWRYDSLLRPMLLWRAAAMSQAFAIAFNVGAIAALVFLALFSDPAFGWRSTLLEEPQMAKCASAVAWPWAGFIDNGYPDAEQITATRYTTLDPTFTGGRSVNEGGVARWSAWWRFLVASFVFYGLLPRIVLAGVCHWRLAKQLRSTPLDDADCRELLRRLHSGSADNEVSPSTTAPRNSATANHTQQSTTAAAAITAGGSCVLLVWAGVEHARDTIEPLLGGRTIQSFHRVGALQSDADEQALAAVEACASDVGVCLIVEAWEPPKADYLDFLDKLRAAAGERRNIEIFAWHQDRAGDPIPPRDADMRLWRSQLAQRADRYLHVAALLGDDA